MAIATQDERRALEDLGQRWADAERSGDADGVAALLAEDFVAVGPRGFVLDRHGWLERYRSGLLAHDAFRWTDEQAHAYGDTAVVVGTLAQESTYGDQRADAELRVTQVAVRVDGRWVIAGIHLSPIVEGPPR